MPDPEGQKKAHPEIHSWSEPHCISGYHLAFDDREAGGIVRDGLEIDVSYMEGKPVSSRKRVFCLSTAFSASIR